MRISHLAGAAKAVLLATLSRLSPQEIREVAWMAAAISAPSSPASRLEDNPPQAIYGSPFGSSEVVVPPNYLTHSSLQAAWAPDASAYTIYLDDNGVRQFKCNWLYCPRWCVATRTRERELKCHAQTHLETPPPAKALDEEDLEQEQGVSSQAWGSLLRIIQFFDNAQNPSGYSCGGRNA
ncbi:hypothetical protein K466DRAFT_570014 [Polyporus arcularius HHB13444]|uniref:Uncharacterized protein n=1 Tax=Polyporus arcularius HHB13444 TaxID=1314778 RepID=A0A5C3P249_9APHY|nr:hypothetical protein K466DRAFT_570014 [Polyporus arcularius HHB13444]